MSSDVKDRIIEHAAMQFTKNGIRSITMDDIAVELCISKRTIYEQFKDKQNLVLECFHFFEEKKRISETEIYRNSENTIDFLTKIFLENIKSLREVSNAFISDLQKFFPEISDRITEKKKERIKYLTQILEKGKEEGLIHKSFDASELSFLFNYEMGMIFNEEQFNTSKEKFISTYKTMFLIYLRGISTEAGLKKIEQIICNGI